LSPQLGGLPLALYQAGCYLPSPFAKVAETVDHHSVTWANMWLP